MNGNDTEYWIYHERQVSLLCGQHALNNLVQANVFQPQYLAEIAHQLDQMELNFMAENNEGGIRSRDYLNRVAEGSANVDPSGNFSIEVLRAALRNKYGLDLPNVLAEAVSNFGDVTGFEGFICNRDAHWFAIRMINGRFWNLNSMEERPEIISHFKLATEIAGFQNSGYTVFCVPNGLPPACTTKAQREEGLPQYWWKEDGLVKGKGKDAVNAATDTWSNVGSGIRLDGRSTTSNENQIEGLTEDQMVQMALKASLESVAAPSVEKEKITLTPEPSKGTPETARIQFRLPNGNRSVRRFLKSDLVTMVYAYVESESNDNGGSHFELRYGFPPKDLQPMRTKTIGDANLSGESIQCRSV
mmetsp:Transcript_33108/g.78238  ORF Transcript_33108/g.78238 Transcript_33108/m.78238 type:complete len:359 (-) Transcript_33108:836-1912(-)